RPRGTRGKGRRIRR
nr:Chain A, BIV TAT PEPTIDE [unidentified]